MRRHRQLALAMVLIVAPGCSVLQRKKAPKPFVPPPMVVRTVPVEPLVVGEPPLLPGLALDIAAIPFPNLGPPIELPERPAPPPPKPRPAPVPAPTVETPPEPTPPPVQVPKLTRILTDADARKFNGEIDTATRTAEQILEVAARRQLNATQQELAQQVRTFVRQAREQREADLAAARSLAGRALILARDLQRTLR